MNSNYLSQWVKDQNLLKQALTHSSYANEGFRKETHNERLEFLGDSVLQLVVTEWLYHHNSHWTEGQLSQGRAAIVCEATLAEAATNLHVGELLRLGRGEERSGGRAKHSLLADAMEAIIGAIYLDSGLEQARQFIQEVLSFALTSVEQRETGRDHKTALNEWLRRRGEEATYEVVGSYGPDHAKSFEVEVSVGGIPIGRAIGHSKKEAEQQSARLALKHLMEEAEKASPSPHPSASSPD
ncbi:ribonuclease III [Sulfobacillus thermosulfidooxidans]|uniref:Ribonuclease 3 n=2 Tax=Sulfobacillus thermosulfidooxidans TaxID=28034 RepID=A0A1W1WMH4_SULTA|nr:ribonuclease III [Sulfobacillus thermosulfidooxidans]OLZ09683.1 ribonuclease III [Sulfobacillus thermosulfidooxidans]OLZ16010.1 ribonuclease III [Sulfobacillus thermosulfidooxidans]OLZ18142.1 ribonuclease III [Sulfobacillus thermosulfidooxidans]PSR29887.1 MAG: ribonuclease III [Sulfobacillus thermosulfidooxidans]SMC07389.1 ribonuclease-3 [Sulfobacillus thermosulfidooxidans DSM 9293]